MWICFKCGEINDPIYLPMNVEDEEKYQQIYNEMLTKCRSCEASRQGFGKK